MKQLLKPGDVINLTKGMKVYTKLPEKFIYINKRGSNRLTTHDIIVGEVYKNNTNLKDITDEIISDVIKAFQFNGLIIDSLKAADFVMQNLPSLQDETFIFSEGQFLVIRTSTDGGSTGRDFYPDGHHVFCKRLINGNYDEDGEECDFYQTGCFTATNKNIIPIDEFNFTPLNTFLKN